MMNVMTMLHRKNNKYPLLPLKKNIRNNLYNGLFKESSNKTKSKNSNISKNSKTKHKKKKV